MRAFSPGKEQSTGSSLANGTTPHPVAISRGTRYNVTSKTVEVDMRISRSRVLLGSLVACGLAFGPSLVAHADAMPKIDHAYAAPSPTYPDAAQYSGEQGDVLLGIQVLPNGRPRKIRVKQSSGFQDLDDAAVSAAANWRYVPASASGDTEMAWTTVRVRYVLPQVAPQPAPATKKH
jgi:TonB family protein